MPAISSGASIYRDLIKAGWLVVALTTFIFTNSLVCAVIITIGLFITLLVAHEMILYRAPLVPIAVQGHNAI